jgi:hemoglobin
MNSAHPQHVAVWLSETFGGPAAYTAEHGGYEHMVSKHRNLGLTEAQRQRWVMRMAQTADVVGKPADPDFRSTFVAYLEWGTRIALINSQPDADVIEHAPVPKWGWGNTPPFEPQSWDDPHAADEGRARYAQEHQVRP